MAVIAERIDPREWVEDRDQHIWQSPRLLGAGGHICLLAKRSARVVGRWVVPTQSDGGCLVATPKVRLLPYAAPQLLDPHPRDRRETLKVLMSAVTPEVTAIALPLQPGFHDLGAFDELGGFCEARHTHRFESTFDIRNVCTKARNHYDSARRDTILSVHADTRRFDFDRAIIDSCPDRISLRREFAHRLADDNRVAIVEATRSGRITGQLLILRSGHWAIFMHTWFDRSFATRGTPTLLTLSGVDHSFRELNARSVDLEGSVLASVDEFMDGLGAAPVAYPVLYWARDRARLLQLVNTSLSIEGRQRDVNANLG